MASDSYPLTGEQKAAGWVWQDLFASEYLTRRNGATIVGAPTWEPNGGGVTLDGATDHLTYGEKIAGQLGRLTEFFWFFEVTPDFAYDQNAYRFLLDTSAAARSYVAKTDNAANNTLNIAVNGSFIAAIPAATWGPHWNVGQRNILIVSGISGNTNAWLNRTQILTADVSAWASADQASLYLGSNNAGVVPFDGTFHRFEFGNRLLNNAEVQDITDGNTFRDLETDRSVITLPLEQSYDNAGGDRITPCEGQLRGVLEPQMGDGTTAATFPTLIHPNGATFDGGDYIEIPDHEDLSFGNGVTDHPFSVSCVVSVPSFASQNFISKYGATDATREWTLYTTATGYLLWLLYDTSGGNRSIYARYDGFLAGVQAGFMFHIIGTYDGSGSQNGMEIYLQGQNATDAQAFNGVYTAMSDTNQVVEIGRRLGAYTTGRIWLPRVMDFELTPQQAHALAYRDLEQMRRYL